MQKQFGPRAGLFLVVLAALAGLGSCALSQIGAQGGSDRLPPVLPATSAADFAHLMGEWHGIYYPADLAGSPFSDDFVFRRDGTYTEVADFPPLMSDSGTVEIDPATRTITVHITSSLPQGFVPIPYDISYTYSFSTDHKTLTVENPETGTGVYSRQTRSPDFEHLVGAWQGAFTPADPAGSPFSDSFVFRRDGTYSETASFPGGELTTAGTIMVDPATHTMTWFITDASDPSMIGSGSVVDYAFSTDSRTLTVCQTEGSGAGTAVYTRP